MAISQIEIENAHKACTHPQIKKGTPEWKRLVRAAMMLYCRKDTLSCAKCGEHTAHECHHIVHRRNGKKWGGCDHLGNLIPLCRQCHIEDPVRVKDITALSELPQFRVLVERIQMENETGSRNT